ncbi:MAG: VCBS repeat-containing protein [Planctomycetota bacterium]|jgi:hypothetical protein
MAQDHLIPTLLASLQLLAAPSLAQVGGAYGADGRIDDSGLFSRFGHAVALVDLNLDGAADLLVAAPTADSGPWVDNGRLQAWSGRTGRLMWEVKGGQIDEHLGEAITILEDRDGDGAPEVLVAGWGVVGDLRLLSGRTGGSLADLPEPSDSNGIRAMCELGDVDGDGTRDLLLGAPSATTTTAPLAGAAYLLSGSDGSLLLQVDGLTRGDSLGEAVAAADDHDGDGIGDFFLATSELHVGGLDDVGRVELRSSATGAVIRQWDGSAAYQEFGRVLASGQDLDGDGLVDLAVGVPDDFVEVYSSATGGLLLRLDAASPGEEFGAAVAMVSDLDGDELGEILVGAPRAMTVVWGVRSGAASLFLGGSGVEAFLIRGPNFLVQLGHSVAVAPGPDADGRLRFAAGGPEDGFNPTGTVSLFNFEPFLVVDAEEISAATGGAAHLELHFPSTFAGRPYRVLFSASGVGPTTFGVKVPLTDDALLRRSLAGSAPFSQSAGLQGRLDAAGRASASFTLLPGAAGGVVGRHLDYAAVVFGPGPTGLASSVARRLTIQP